MLDVQVYVALLYIAVTSVLCREAARNLETAQAELVQSKAELKRAQDELQEAGKSVFPAQYFVKLLASEA